MRRLIFVLLTLIGTNARAEAAPWNKGFVNIRPDSRLWVEQRAAQNGRPTLFVANGLTYSTTQWQALVASLDKIDPDLGLVLYDMVNMGKTLLDRVPDIPEVMFDDQMRDLKDLYTTLNIPGPKYLIGLSYGGGLVLNYLASYPNDFERVIAEAPYLRPLADQDNFIKNEVTGYKLMFPFDPRSKQDLYDIFLRDFVYKFFPLAEPVLLENPFKTEGVYRMVQGSETWEVRNVMDNYPAGKLFLVVGDKDQYIPLADQTQFWRELKSSAKASMVIIRGASHKLPEVVPDFDAQLIVQILNGNPALNQGLTFQGDLLKGQLTSDNLVIPLNLKATATCDTQLRRTK